MRRLLASAFAIVSLPVFAQPVAVVTHAVDGWNVVDVVDTTTDTVRTSIPLCRFAPACPSYAVAVVSDGSRAWVSAMLEPAIFDVDLVTGHVDAFAIPSIASAMVLSPD